MRLLGWAWTVPDVAYGGEQGRCQRHYKDFGSVSQLGKALAHIRQIPREVPSNLFSIIMYRMGQR